MRLPKYRVYLPLKKTMIYLDALYFPDKNISYYWGFGDDESGEVNHNFSRSDYDGFPMQFVHLKDKQGKEIYEKDIVKQYFEVNRQDDFYSGWHIGEVVIIPSKGVCLRNPVLYNEEDGSVRKTKGYIPVRSYRSEVIGDVHRNTKLVEQLNVLSIEGLL